MHAITGVVVTDRRQCYGTLIGSKIHILVAGDHVLLGPSDNGP